MRHRSTLATRVVRPSPARAPRRPRLLLGALVTVGLAALFLAVPVVSGKVTNPPPAALQTPAPGAQSTAGSVVVMGEDGAPLPTLLPAGTAPAAPSRTPAAPTAASSRVSSTAPRRESPAGAGSTARPGAPGSAGPPGVGLSAGSPARTTGAPSSNRPTGTSTSASASSGSTSSGSTSSTSTSSTSASSTPTAQPAPALSITVPPSVDPLPSTPDVPTP